MRINEFAYLNLNLSGDRLSTQAAIMESRPEKRAPPLDIHRPTEPSDVTVRRADSYRHSKGESRA